MELGISPDSLDFGRRVSHRFTDQRLATLWSISFVLSSNNTMFSATLIPILALMKRDIELLHAGSPAGEYNWSERWIYQSLFFGREWLRSRLVSCVGIADIDDFNTVLLVMKESGHWGFLFGYYIVYLGSTSHAEEFDQNLRISQRKILENVILCLFLWEITHVCIFARQIESSDCFRERHGFGKGRSEWIQVSSYFDW